ncbi:MAG: hypothetical protein WCI55_02180 [Armatimonadota bacterium]
MKSDRRTIVVFVVFLTFLVFSLELRSQFLFGARLATGQITAKNWTLGSSNVGPNTFSISAWSFKHPPARANRTRNEELGLVIVRALHTYNSKETMKGLEEYCNQNPQDIKAKAHLLRMSLNASGPLEKRSPDNEKDILFAGRLVKVAGECALIEPNNWYWRERQFHMLFLLSDFEKATTVLTARPFPSTYEDYVIDEVTCKEELYRSNFSFLPKSALLEVWGGTLFPHLNTNTQIEKLIKKSPDPLLLRIAQIDLGRVMAKSAPTAIAAMVGVSNINHGIWGLKSPAPGRIDKKDIQAQNQVQGIYEQSVSKEAWDYCIRASKSDIRPRFLRPDEELAALFVGQLGPFFEFAGILCCLVGLIMIPVGQSKINFINKEVIGWPLVLIVFTFIGSTWKDWANLGNYGLGCPLLPPLLFVLSLISIYWSLRGEKGKRLFPVIFVLVALCFGLASSAWQATSVIVLTLFALQRGAVPLKPWTTAIGIFLLAYHVGLNLGLSNAFNENILYCAIGTVALLAVSQRPLEPDQPRLSSLTTGIASIILGTVLTAQYDRGVQRSMENELKQTQQVREQFARL